MAVILMQITCKPGSVWDGHLSSYAVARDSQAVKSAHLADTTILCCVMENEPPCSR